MLAALFLLCMALGGAVGDPLNGALFNLANGYRPLFLMMAGYTVLAFVAVLFVPTRCRRSGHGPIRLCTCNQSFGGEGGIVSQGP